MPHSENICSICAWRETCKKKFSVSGRDVRCADFTKELSVKSSGQDEQEEKEEDKERK
jgi:hypothetical protein